MNTLAKFFCRLPLRRPLLYVCPKHSNRSLHASVPHAQMANEPYRNRYTHHRKAFPGKTNIVYGTYVAVVLGLLFFFSAGGGHYLDELEANYIKERRKKKKGIVKAECQTSVVSPLETDSIPDDDGKCTSTKKRAGFRDRKFIAYEDRIRAYSTPDKIFRYFATLKSSEDETDVIYMTPDDFVRAITPGLKQPEGLELDAFKRYDPKVERLNLNIPKDSVFYQLCDNALISFSDFVFLLTVLSTPRRQFEIAFKMFDLNGDGEVDADEFEVVRSVIMDITPVGRRHRDHATTGSTLKTRSNSALKQYFFGPDGKQKLTIKTFLDFHAKLQEEITRLEFNRASPIDGKITEVQFANFLLTYAGFSEQKRRKMIRSVKHKYSDSENCVGISYRDFADINLLLHSISDVDTALTFHHMAGAAIDQATLQHVASTVAHIKLSPHLVDVVFTLFDENNDGQLSYREFVGVMRHRLLRGLDKPMDTGFVRFVNALCGCALEQLHYKSSSEK